MKIFLRAIVFIFSIAALVVGIFWLNAEPKSYEAITSLLLGIAGFAGLIIEFINSKNEKDRPLETLDQRNRRVMLNHVEEFWIKGILEKSLFGETLLELGIKETPDALNLPGTINRPSTDETFPLGKSMLEIFEEIGLGRSLLILGAPGSGKTTMLLELTRQLIDVARQDKTYPLPVVFNLSSWIEKQTFEDWLVSELNDIYFVPKKTASDWVTGNKILLLLDGLDEVPENNRSKCVEAINQFRKEHGLTSLVVCCRSQEYARIVTHLAFDGAIEIQALTIKQVYTYLEILDKHLEDIKQVLEKDAALKEMMQTPLFLRIMILAYQGLKNKRIKISNTNFSQRKFLIDTYIEHMFERVKHKKSIRFTKVSVITNLAWLARKMLNQSQSLLLIEGMQPNRLLRPDLIKTHRSILLIISFLFTGLPAGILLGVLIGKHLGVGSGLLGGILGGLHFGRIEALGAVRFQEKFEIPVLFDKFIWSWSKAKAWLPIMLPKKLRAGLGIGLMSGWILGIFYGIKGMILSVFVSLLTAIISLVIVGLQGITVGIRSKPGQGFKNNFKTWFIFSLSIAVTGGITGWFLSELLNEEPTFHSIGFLLGFFTGAHQAAMVSTFSQIVSHLALRVILFKDIHFPLNLISFLNYSTDLIFLRRVGGGYIFIHRLLMEHFAEMYNEGETTHT